jgi:hypothetical protein
MEVIEGPSGRRIFLLAVIRGLESERVEVRKALGEASADAIAISISEEELKALDDYEKGDVPPSNFEEDVYIGGLSRFGEVKKPPPCFLEARDLARSRGLRFLALDMDDHDYTEAYVSNVGTVEMMLHSMSEGRLRRKQFKAETPRDFVLEFDSVVNGSKGFKRLETARENHMAERLAELSRDCATILAVVEVERAEGVGHALSRHFIRHLESAKPSGTKV